MVLNDRRILITGAGGFIGCALLKRFRDLSPVAVYHQSKPEFEGYSLRSVDLSDESSVSGLMKEVQPDIVYHLAGMTSPKRNEKNAQLATDSHIKATENLVNHLPSGAHIVFTSTDKVFDGTLSDPDENTKTCPHGLYARLKIECEDLIRNRVKKHHILRLGIVHALGEEWACRTGSGIKSVIDNGIVKLRAGQTVEVFNNVERTFVRLSQLVDFFNLLLTDEHYGLYHVGSGKMSYYERMKQLGTELGIAWQGHLLPVSGTVTPLVQGLSTEKLVSTFNIIFN